MENGIIFRMSCISLLVAISFLAAIAPLANCDYYTEWVPQDEFKEKSIKLVFYVHDNITGNLSTASLVAQPILNSPKTGEFDPKVFAIDSPVTESRDPKSKAIGNLLGLYLISSRRDIPNSIVLLTCFDFAFTKGTFANSSISVFSRNPVTEPLREVALVGGRGKFRSAKGYVQVRTIVLNQATGDASLEFTAFVTYYD